MSKIRLPRKRKLLPEKIHWRETPEWQQQVYQVLKLKERGFDVTQTVQVTQIAEMEVKRILEEEEINRSIIQRQWANKIPIMRDVVAMGLNGIHETLKEMANPEVRQKMIRNVADLSALTKIVESLNMLLRLEEGKSTSNVSNKVTHTVQETKVLLRDLAKIDPVFEYEGEVEVVDGKLIEDTNDSQ